MDTRILIAVLLSFAAVIAYQELVLKRLYPPPSSQTTKRQVPTGAASTAAPKAQPTPAAVVQGGVEQEAGRRPERILEVGTELFDAAITSRGARLKSFRLKRYHESASPGSAPLEMIRPAPGGELPLGVVIARGGETIDDRDIDYVTSAPARLDIRPGEGGEVAFTGGTPDGLKVTKTLRFSAESYAFDLSAEVASRSGGLSGAGYEISEPLTAHKGYYDVPEVQALLNDKTLVEGEKTLRKGIAPQTGKITYAGFGDRYFLSVFLPQGPDDGSLEMSYDGDEARAELLFAATGDGALKLATQVYIGPKQLDTLEAVNPHLSKAIDFGWTGILALVFLRALKLFHHVTPNYGVDIILLTVAIRIVFLPMSIRGQRSMMRLQRLQPQLERIREKFKDDSERLNREMVDLYRRNHVNPLGGCLPMVLQLPIFIGLYQALLNAVELRHAPFVGWIRDLSAPECLPIPHLPVLPLTECSGIPVLVLLMGVSTFLQQQMTPQAPDPNQQKMMMLMPIVFTVMFVNFPAGLTLYYFASNVLGIIQQVILNREFKQNSINP